MWQSLRLWLSRRRFEDGMQEELRFHIEQVTAELIQSGVPPQEAARRARMDLEGLNTIQEECREARGLRPFDELARQVRYAVRLLRKTPGFTATAVLTVAVCIGANLTVFAVIDSILIRPLPFPDSGRLVTMFNSYPKAGVERDGSSITNYYERRGQIPAFSSLALYRNDSVVINAEREPAMFVTADFFPTLGAAPSLGRSFAEDEPARVVILSDAYWRSKFNADEHAIGQQLLVNDTPATVIGVLPPDFRFLSSNARLFLPLRSSLADRAPAGRHSGGNSKHLIARLQPGATLQQAQAQIDAQDAALNASTNESAMLADTGFRTIVDSLHADHVASVRSMLLLWQAGAFALLLIGVVNLMNLLAIRANGRGKELAVRQALGAGGFHIVSEVGVETTLLTLTGAALGLAFGAAGVQWLRTLGAANLPLGSHIAVNGRLAAAAFAGAILLGILLAVPLARRNLRERPNHSLQSQPRGGTASVGAQRLRQGFIIAQIALAFLLLAGAGLLGISLQRAMAVSPGFQADHVLTARLTPSWMIYSTWAARLAFNDRVMRELNRQPGIVATGVINNPPFSGNNGKSAATIPGRVRRPGEPLRANYSFGVDGDYFTAMGFVLRQGRFLTADDSRRAPRVCVVDDDFARYYWPTQSPIGQRLFLGASEHDPAEAFTVVGVAGAAKQAGLTDESAQGAVYYPYALRTDDNLFLVARTSLPPETLSRTVQNVVHSIGPDVPVSDVQTMDERIASSLLTLRSPAQLVGLFSLIALLLTALGTYGVVSYTVSQRRREIGLRLALGALPAQIRAQFLLSIVKLLLPGLALGLCGAWAAGHAMESLLFHVPPLHAGILGATAFAVGLVSVAASLLPAHRAARTSPLAALAEED